MNFVIVQGLCLWVGGSMETFLEREFPFPASHRKVCFIHFLGRRGLENLLVRAPRDFLLRFLRKRLAARIVDDSLIR